MYFILSSRFTDDSQVLWRTAVHRGWKVGRAHKWSAPADLLPDDEVCIYGEPLLVEKLASDLSLTITNPVDDWLTRLPERYVRRFIGYGQLSDARKLKGRWFVKPASSKSFEPRVYEDVKELPDPALLEGSLPVLWSEPVT